MLQIFEKEQKGKGHQEHCEGVVGRVNEERPRQRRIAQYFESLAPYSRTADGSPSSSSGRNEKVLRLKASEIDREKSWFCFGVVSNL